MWCLIIDTIDGKKISEIQGGNFFPQMNTPLKDIDSEVFAIIKDEEERQKSCINLIASEVCIPGIYMKHEKTGFSSQLHAKWNWYK